MIEQSHKIAIVGAGTVGSTIAYACLLRGLARRIALYDIDLRKVQAQALDLSHGLQFVSPAVVEGSNDASVCSGADVIIITAGAKQKPGQSRMELASVNTGILRQIVPVMVRVAPDAIILLVTNPVDVMTFVAHKLSGLPRSRVFGSGTVLDSSRFRYLIARRCNVAVANVHGYIVGEHGETEIPLWSTANIGNVLLSDWAVPQHGKLTVRDRAEIFANVKTAADQIIRGKGATSFAIGLAVAHILEAIFNDANAILPVSSLLENFRGVSDVCLSMPSIVSRTGVELPLNVPMNAAEEAGLANSAAMVKSSIRIVGFG
jgi:L-lactate dehydrogenase